MLWSSRRKKKFKCTLRDTRRSWASFIESLGIKSLFAEVEVVMGHGTKSFLMKHISYPIGVKVSNPFAADHGRPALRTLSCRLRAVMSTARAGKDIRNFKHLE